MNQDDKWLKKVQNKLKRYISNPMWDCIELSDLNYSIIMHIMNANKAKDLPYVINESLVNNLLKTIDDKFRETKRHIVKANEYEK